MRFISSMESLGFHRMSYQEYEEEIERLLDAQDFGGAARLKAAYEDRDEDIDFCLYFERPNYRLQGMQPMCARACLQGTTFKNYCGHLGNVFCLGPVA